LIDAAIDSLQEDDFSGPPDLESDDDEQGSKNVEPRFAVQDDGMIELMHNINIMHFPDEIIRTKKGKPLRYYLQLELLALPRVSLVSGVNPSLTLVKHRRCRSFRSSSAEPGTSPAWHGSAPSQAAVTVSSGRRLVLLPSHH
jgi:hypothetical protein